MKTIAALSVLVLLAGADVAVAAPALHHPAARHPAARLHRVSRVGHRHRAHQHPPGPLARDDEGVHAMQGYRAADDQAGAPSSPGFYKSEKEHEAGWGFRQGGVHTVVGLYQRPAEPGDIPGRQIYHTPEGRGAAGLSLSFKLGH